MISSIPKKSIDVLPVQQDDPVKVLTEKLFDDQDIKILVLTYLPSASWAKPSGSSKPPMSIKIQGGELRAYDLYRATILGEDISRWDKELPQILDGLKTISECNISSPNLKKRILLTIKNLSYFLENRNHDTFRKKVLMEWAMRPSIQHIRKIHLTLLNTILLSSDAETLDPDSVKLLDTVDNVIFQQSDSIFSKALKDFYRELIDLRKSVVSGSTDLREDQLEKFKSAAKSLIDEKKSAVVPFFIPQVLSSLILIKWTFINEKKIERLFFDLMNYSIPKHKEYASQTFTEIESLGRYAISDHRPLFAKRLTDLMNLLLLDNPHMVHPLKDRAKERIFSSSGYDQSSVIVQPCLIASGLLCAESLVMSLLAGCFLYKCNCNFEEGNIREPEELIHDLQLGIRLGKRSVFLLSRALYFYAGFEVAFHTANWFNQRWLNSWNDSDMGKNHLYTPLKGPVGKNAMQSGRKVFRNGVLSPLPNKVLESSKSNSDQNALAHLAPKSEPLKIKRF